MHKDEKLTQLRIQTILNAMEGLLRSCNLNAEQTEAVIRAEYALRAIEKVSGSEAKPTNQNAT